MSALRGHDELHVVVVTAHLLRACRSLARSLDLALQRRHGAFLPYGPYLAEIEAVIEDASTALDPEFLGAETLIALVEHIEGASDEEDLALRVRDAATALDLRRGGHFFARFAGQRLECEPGSAFPVAPTDVIVEELGSARGLSPAPDGAEVPPRLGVPLDGTSRLRLCPEGLGRLRVVLDARRAGVVDTLFSGDRIAAPGPSVMWSAVVPTCDLFADLTCDFVDGCDPPGFYGVRPRPAGAEQYRARLLKGLAIAAAHGASIIVVPELSTDAETEQIIARWFAATPSVALVVAGSRHLDGEGEPRRNRARILLRGAPADQPLHHDKFSSYSIVLEEGGVQRTEWIERPNVLTIVAGRRWSFCPLICKDFLEPTARRILIDLRVRAVLVASMSPKTGLYVTDAAAVAQDAQALVFVSNIPHKDSDHTAILAQPRLGATPASQRQHPGGIVAFIHTAGTEFEVEAI